MCSSDGSHDERMISTDDVDVARSEPSSRSRSRNEPCTGDRGVTAAPFPFAFAWRGFGLPELA